MRWKETVNRSTNQGRSSGSEGDTKGTAQGRLFGECDGSPLPKPSPRDRDWPRLLTNRSRSGASAPPAVPPCRTQAPETGFRPDY